MITASQRTSPAMPGRRSARTRLQGAGSRPKDRLFPQLSEPLDGRGPDRSPGCTPVQADSRPAVSVERQTTIAPPEAAPERGQVSWVLHGSVDPAPGCGRHCQDLRGSLPSLSRLEDPPRGRMELSEAGTPSPGARRGEHSTMACQTVAPYKKTPKRPVEALSFSTRAGSCFSPWSAGAGRPAGRRRFFASGTAEIDSPRSAPSPSLPVGNDSISIGPCIPTTPDPQRCSASSRSCVAIFPADSFLSGTAAARFGQNMSSSGWPIGSVSMSNGSRPTPLDLNPVECLWSRTKYGDLANFAADDLSTLEHAVAASLCRTQSRRDLFHGFFQGAELKF